MVYNTQDYWVFWTFPPSSILETRKHDVSETGSVSVIRYKGGGNKTPTQLGPLERANLTGQPLTDLHSYFNHSKPG
jgi:hypothetical protein